MNEVVREWIDKAEGDFRTACREFEADPPNYDAVCYHAQQCIEKYMKALLIEKGQLPPRIHDLVVLGNLLKATVPAWDWPIEELRLLSRAAVVYRYPGESAEAEEAEIALQICKAQRPFLNKLLCGQGED